MTSVQRMAFGEGPLWPAHCGGRADMQTQSVLPNQSARGATVQAPWKQGQASVFNFSPGSLYQ